MGGMAFTLGKSRGQDPRMLPCGDASVVAGVTPRSDGATAASMLLVICGHVP